MKRDWIPTPKEFSDKWDARITETARKNPDWIPELYETGSIALAWTRTATQQEFQFAQQRVGGLRVVDSSSQ